jgi:hypothetical protein
VVFSKILHDTQNEISIKSYPTPDNASYIINNKVGIYIKYSTKRMSPWQFSFLKRHQDEILDMKKTIGKVFLILVCKDDGIVSLSFEELKQILDENHSNAEWIIASRNKRKMYSVRGSDGTLKFKISRREFPEKILTQL